MLIGQLGPMMVWVMCGRGARRQIGAECAGVGQTDAGICLVMARVLCDLRPIPATTLPDLCLANPFLAPILRSDLTRSLLLPTAAASECEPPSPAVQMPRILQTLCRDRSAPRQYFMPLGPAPSPACWDLVLLAAASISGSHTPRLSPLAAARPDIVMSIMPVPLIYSAAQSNCGLSLCCVQARPYVVHPSQSTCPP